MVPFDDRAVESAHRSEALLGKRIVAHDVAHADVVRAKLRLSVGKHCLQGVEVGVNVAENGKSHLVE